MDATLRKRKGVHYTPPELARFLASQTFGCLPRSVEKVTILDPACGAGQLLASLIECLQESEIRSISVVGFDTDPAALKQAAIRLEEFELAKLRLFDQDFLDSDFSRHDYDCVIANPPYVRTQVLGEKKAKALSRKFGLKGRVDLYQAFAVAISKSLKRGGALGLLTSNRFLTVKSGAAMRQLLRSEFELRQVFDLGDTRLFDAAVLPVIVTGVKRDQCDPTTQNAKYHRVYRIDNDRKPVIEKSRSILAAMGDEAICGKIATTSGRVLIERGELVADEGQSAWTLANSVTRRWLNQIRTRQIHLFGDLAEIKVGIKTTADSVFIREDWADQEPTLPEKEMLRPLITHHDALRWSILSPKKTVLYPYDLQIQKRTPIELDKFPRTRSYVEQHREQLESRRYVVESGRHWYEIWVPHQPTDWAKPKIVWPDISEQPKFFFDSSGAIVNGDCYWIKLRPGVDPDWLYLMLAVANSQVATKFYDTVFHNKLYAGRRRFMTQYVKEFPLPELDSKLGQQIVRLVNRLIESPNTKNESKLEDMVQQAFGFK